MRLLSMVLSTAVLAVPALVSTAAVAPVQTCPATVVSTIVSPQAVVCLASSATYEMKTLADGTVVTFTNGIQDKTPQVKPSADKAKVK